MPRLVFLAAKLGPEAVKMSRELKKVIPHFDLYDAVAREGINAAAITLEIPRRQLTTLFNRGKTAGDATFEEWRLLVAQEVLEEIDLPVKEQLSVMGQLERWVQRKDDELVAIEEVSMDDMGDGQGIPKFMTGFTPLDMCLQGGGAYQGLLVIMAPPGVGKTSIMLSILEGIHEAFPEAHNYFFEMEIPRPMMVARMAPIAKRSPFKPTDRLFTGSIPIEDVEKKLDEFGSEDEDRVVFVDGPDAMPGLGSEGRRLELGHIYRRLVKIKERSRLVVVSSQPNRAGIREGSMKLSSMAESWEKAWYADMVVAVNSVGLNKMRMVCLKNRFGQKDGEVIFDYDLADLTWTDPYLEEDDW